MRESDSSDSSHSRRSRARGINERVLTPSIQKGVSSQAPYLCVL